MLDRGDYKSDYDIMCEMYKNVKTDDNRKQHNAIANNSGNYKEKHEHVYYDPKTGKTGWHGLEYETRHNR